jgi:hypothetical protein
MFLDIVSVSSKKRHISAQIFVLLTYYKTKPKLNCHDFFTIVVTAVVVFWKTAVAVVVPGDFSC